MKSLIAHLRFYVLKLCLGKKEDFLFCQVIG
jgi:hypothetical protein